MAEITIDLDDIMRRSGMRVDVIRFAVEMEKLMAKNDKEKGDSWKTTRVKELLGFLDEEFDELRWEIDEMNVDEVQRILVNVANYCMMSYIRFEERRNNNV